MGILRSIRFKRILSIITLFSFASLLFIAAPNVFADKIDGWLEEIEALIEKIAEKYLKALRTVVKNIQIRRSQEDPLPEEKPDEVDLEETEVIQAVVEVKNEETKLEKRSDQVLPKELVVSGGEEGEEIETEQGAEKLDGDTQSEDGADQTSQVKGNEADLEEAAIIEAVLEAIEEKTLEEIGSDQALPEELVKSADPAEEEIVTEQAVEEITEDIQSEIISDQVIPEELIESTEPVEEEIIVQETAEVITEETQSVDEANQTVQTNSNESEVMQAVSESINEQTQAQTGSDQMLPEESVEPTEHVEEEITVQETAEEANEDTPYVYEETQTEQVEEVEPTVYEASPIATIEPVSSTFEEATTYETPAVETFETYSPAVEEPTAYETSSSGTIEPDQPASETPKYGYISKYTPGRISNYISNYVANYVSSYISKTSSSWKKNDNDSGIAKYLSLFSSKKSEDAGSSTSSYSSTKKKRSLNQDILNAMDIRQKSVAMSTELKEKNIKLDGRMAGKDAIGKKRK